MTHDDAYQLDYLTRASGANRWTGHLFADGPSSIPDNRLTISPTPDGKHILIVGSACANEAVTVEVTANAVKLPKPPLASPGEPFENCRNDDGGVLVTAAVALPHDKADILLENDDSSTGDPMIATGTPGTAFDTPQPLPDPTDVRLTALAITRDPVSGELTVIADSPQHGVYAWTRPPGAAWPEPILIAADASATSWSYATVTSFAGTITVGLEGTVGSISRLYTVTPRPGGSWSRPTLLPHQGSSANTLVLVANPTNGHLHAVYARGGIWGQVDTAGTWSRTHRVRKSPKDSPLQITLTAGGHMIVSYLHYYDRD